MIVEFDGVRFSGHMRDLREELEWVARDALRDALKHGVEAMKSTRTFQDRTTHLRNSMRSRQRGLEGELRVDASYAAYLNFGTGLFGRKHRKYPIVPKKTNKRGLLRFVWHGEVWVLRRVMHPGVKPRLFATNAGSRAGHFLERRLDELLDSAIKDFNSAA